MDSLLELFCDVDDFCKLVLPVRQNLMLTSRVRQRQRKRSVRVSAIITILTYFHPPHYRHFKASSPEHVLKHLRREFPGLVSTTRFVARIPAVLAPLDVSLRTACLETCTGISVIDSTALAGCKHPRIHYHQVCAGRAEWSTTSAGWLVGFKRHLGFDDRGKLLNLMLTPGYVDDRTPVTRLAHTRFGTVVGSKGHRSTALRDERFRAFGVELVTGISSDMKHMPTLVMDKILLRKRAIVEPIIRSPINFLVNLLCGLLTYGRRPKKPSLGLGTLPALLA